MLYVAIWYVSIRPVVMRVKEELQILVSRPRSPNCSLFSNLRLFRSSSFTLITTGRIETYQIATYSIRTLLKMDYWSPKHVELLNVMNKISLQVLCILLGYICIAQWYTVHTISKKSKHVVLYNKKNLVVFGEILVSRPKPPNCSLLFGFSTLRLFRIFFCPLSDMWLTHLILHDVITRVISD